ncbi:MAG: hypothetical protein LBG98_02345 [Puniceicoccales bacterium]|nr:hypothetical protein [Puniceicoccales bacterium]
MARNRLSPKDITNDLSRFHGPLHRRWAEKKSPRKHIATYREGSQSLCDRITLYLLMCFGVGQCFVILFFDLF